MAVDSPAIPVVRDVLGSVCAVKLPLTVAENTRVYYWERGCVSI
jgi:hypothetical protein